MVFSGKSVSVRGLLELSSDAVYMGVSVSCWGCAFFIVTFAANGCLEICFLTFGCFVCWL